MVKFFLKTLSFFFVLIISITIYLSYFGLKTDRFDSLIKNKANELNTYVKLSFRETKIYINPIKLNLIVKLQNPKVLIGSGEIILSKLDFFLPIGSFFSSDFILRRAEVAFKKNDIKDLTKISKIFLPNILNKQLKKIFKKGSLEGEFTIPLWPSKSVVLIGSLLLAALCANDAIAHTRSFIRAPFINEHKRQLMILIGFIGGMLLVTSIVLSLESRASIGLATIIINFISFDGKGT